MSLCFRCHGIQGSYLDLPRLTFTGLIQVDVSTSNNDECNYNSDVPLKQDGNWNIRGTGEVRFVSCFVTSALYQKNAYLINSDPVINSKVVNNLNMPFPKIADLDVRNQLTSVIYGLNFGIVYSDGEVAFQGLLEHMPLVQDVWKRVICTNTSGSTFLSSKAVSVLTHIKWGNITRSPLLMQLHDLRENLSITLTVYNYVKQPKSRNFTLAKVVGAIGAAKEHEPLHFAGDRIMTYEDVNPISLPLSGKDSCYNNSGKYVWMYKAPFNIYTPVHKPKKHRLSVDFSNALSMEYLGTERDIQEIWLAVKAKGGKCIVLLGDPIPYRDENWDATGNIVDRDLDVEYHDLLKFSPLLVVRKLFGPSMNDQSFFATSSEILLECENIGRAFEVMLREPSHFLRPMGQYLGKIEYNHTMIVELKLTNFGQPVANEIVRVFEAEDTKSDSIPSGGVQTETTATTNKDGIASFLFRAVVKILPPRKYSNNITCNNIQPPNNITEAPIEGQLYTFNYNSSGTPNSSIQFNQLLTSINQIAIVGSSYFEAPEKPNWIEHIQPIFKQYEHLYPVMKDFIQLGNYTQVTLTHNLNMIKFAMSRDINHPNYMPVTRDLSTTKRKMILQWLDQKPKPLYTSNVPMDEKILDTYMHARCDICHGAEEIQDLYYQNLYTRKMEPTLTTFHIRPLFKLGVKNSKTSSLRSMSETCTVMALQQQLQNAIQLEFATIPPYITTLYSIKEGTNEEIHKRIRSIVIQEMQHLTQAANILIAIGGKPKIDGKEYAPNYPGFLPGGVLPNLKITLEKLSIQYVKDVLMGIEVPHNISLDSDHEEIFNDTIGQFYKEIEVCIDHLKDDIFKDSNVAHQIMWPWNAPTVGRVLIVNDYHTAIKAIQHIVEQGEGASPLDPSMGNSVTTAPFFSHFYNFEEIVCQKHLVLNSDDRFCFNGDNIPFSSSEVWPMQSNPGKTKVPQNSKCYIAARSFHYAYRALLRKLQEVFDGDTHGLKDAIAIMYTLAVHGHKTMRTKLEDNSDETCGPVWDYEWDERYEVSAED